MGDGYVVMAVCPRLFCNILEVEKALSIRIDKNISLSL
ncbi:hypothetical protein SSIN_0542 [Streptococcus sinensis]|uniref:Uncharacterized protein n=1 Tax=Streptococcus sinensis TaxID=176090 RepID=A0A0A0DIF7_9STRE|nr:hypothetical protein SSIN_0542 [Streptococcus sinensis]